MSRHSNLLSPARFLGTALVMTCVLIVAVCFLPQSRFIRFTSSREPVLHKGGWVYERLHDDPTPIDAAFIGSSHTVYGVDSEKIEEAAGKILGDRIHVANFGLIHPGRNMDYIVAREILETTRPRMLVIEVQDEEPRAPHIAFYRFAGAGDIAFAPLVINTRYFADLVRLPARQISLFLQTMAPSLFGDDAHFEPAHYRGTYWHDTPAELDDDTPRTIVLSPQELERELAHFRRFVASKLYLPGPLRPLEYRVSLIYLSKIIALAQQKNVPIKFLYLPGWHGEPAPEFASFYERYGEVWIPTGIFDRTDVWQDVNHLNLRGSEALSAWVGQKIGEEWGGSGVAAK